MARRATAALPKGALVSTGVGESRRFNAPEAFEEDLGNPRHMANCTLGGEPVPEHLWNKITYQQTDQGIAEFNVGKEPARATVVRDELHGRISQRGADLDRGMGMEAHDPMKELVNLHVPPGMRPLYMSSAQITKEGTTRGYKVCVDEKGEPVKLGTLVLGYIPEERAAAIQRGFEQKSDEAQREIYGDDYDPRQNGKGRSVTLEPNGNNFERIAKQGDFNRGSGPSQSFDNPDPLGDDLGLQGDAGEDFKL